MGRLNRVVAVAFGLAYLAIAVVGFAVAKDAGFLSRGSDAIGLEFNGLHNIVHLGIGTLLFSSASFGEESARTANLIVGMIYGLAALAGFFLKDTTLNFASVNSTANLLHLGTAIVLLAAGLLPPLDD